MSRTRALAHDGGRTISAHRSCRTRQHAVVYDPPSSSASERFLVYRTSGNKDNRPAGDRQQPSDVRSGARSGRDGSDGTSSASELKTGRTDVGTHADTGGIPDTKSPRAKAERTTLVG